ncbi:hypothetical protein A9179_05130 [Pseudomonas alcaligenes]|uniref:Uncharacterized protein n=1 Tax=Aquipseudomonas alcaligenes TaxID=43263 RepID=A0ABR7RWU7_AQUAC|nr:hypothetical protein [Pseudomonas alcaligenes]MBC9249653.1 hypothetical protein [Pseudomonas alcaligenes]
MMSPQHLRELLLAEAEAPHLSAASALVRVAERLYVVADDMLHLGLFTLADGQPGQLLRLFAGELPDEQTARKAHKPDLEALALLPAMPGLPDGALLGLGSGSKANRQTAVLLALGGSGAIAGEPRLFDLEPLYRPLRQHFADLNIEGAFLLGEEFVLLQRGNQGSTANAAVRYCWRQWQAWLQGEPAPAPRAIEELELGQLGGVALGLTDGTPLADGRWLFSAAAEDTLDSYSDGACLGSVIGLVEGDGQVRRLAELNGRWKVEGIALAADGRLLLVTDGDDPQRAACLLALPLPGLELPV